MLIEREKEIKSISEDNTQQQDKISESNKDLVESIEILVKDHKQLKVEVTNLKQRKIEDSYNKGNQK